MHERRIEPRCTLGEYLGASHYEVHGTPKEVRWWSMATDDEPGPSNEVDAVRWATLEDARELLSYDGERAVVEKSLR